MEERTVNKGAQGPVPDVAVTYYPDTDMVIIQAGKPTVSPIHESESIANYMVAHYDKNYRLFALDVEGAEEALEPLLNAVLRSDDKTLDTLSKSTAFYDKGGDFFGALPEVMVFYTPGTQSLRIQAGDPVHIHRSETIANGMVAHYDDNLSLVALDLEGADEALKPFLDAVLKKEQEKTAQAG